MTIIVHCPHCDLPIIIEEINCAIFRHGVYITTGEQINPHECRQMCEYLSQTQQIYGCGKPFQLIKNDVGVYTARECAYLWECSVLSGWPLLVVYCMVSLSYNTVQCEVMQYGAKVNDDV